MSVLVRPYDYLLDGAVGWNESVALGVEAGDVLTLRRSPSSGSIDTPAGFVDRLRPKGVAASTDAIHVADERRGVIWVWDVCGRFGVLPEIGARAGGRRRIGAPSALAIRNGTDLVVLDEQAGTIHVFTLPDLALRRVVGPSIRSRPPHPGGDWEPTDLAVAPDGSILVADRRGLVWRLDHQLRVERYYRGSLPTPIVPVRIAVDADGWAYVCGTDGELVLLDPRGGVVPGPTELDAAAQGWVDTHYGPEAEWTDPNSGPGAVLPVEVVDALRFERLTQARRALLPGDLAHRLDSIAGPEPGGGTGAVDWQPRFRSVMPSFVADRLGPPRLVPDRDGTVTMTVAHPVGSKCECPAFSTGLVVDGTGALVLGDAVVEHVMCALIGNEPETVLGSRPLSGGVVGVLVDELGLPRVGAAHRDPVFGAVRRRDASLAVEEALVFRPAGEHDRRSALVEAVAALRHWLHPASLTRVVQAVIDAAVVDVAGRPVLGPDALAAIEDLVSTQPMGGPPLTAPPDLRPFVRQGVIQFEPLDSGRLGNRWHRVVLELELPQRTSMQLFAFTSDVDRPDVVATTLPESPNQSPWLAARTNADEWLVQCPPGQFLHLAVVLKGTDDLTPTVSSVSVYRTRNSTLQFLPAAYVEDPDGASTLDRLLSLTDTIFDEIETRIEEFPKQLGAESADHEFLPWLASWFDLSFDPSWDDEQRRRVLAEIIDIYRWRGTKRGLTKLLRLHTGIDGPLPRLVENRCASARPEFERWVGHTDPCAFIVVLPATAIESKNDAGSIERLLRDNIPAHTDFCLRPVVPGVRLGGAATVGSVIGFDTLVGGRRHWRLPAEDSSWPGSPLGRGLPDDPVPRSQGIRVGGPGHASRAPRPDSYQATCPDRKDRP